jgi:hypothetical protein
MLRNHPKIHSNRRDAIEDQLCKQLLEKMVLEIATRLVNDANARQYPNPECNDFSSSATQFAIDVATRHPKEEVKARP